jgi:hypothetical protein
VTDKSHARCQPDTESAAFAKAYPHLDLDQIPDPWGRPIFKHSHVRALWEGWFARACLDDRAQCGVQTEDAAATPATCAVCGERDYPTRQSRCEHPACPPIAATPSDKEIGKQIGTYLGMSGIDAQDVAFIRALVLSSADSRSEPAVDRYDEAMAAIDECIGRNS